MDWVTALVTVVTQGWPVAVVVAAVIFQKDVRDLIPRIRKAGPVELDANVAQSSTPVLPAPPLSSSELRALPGVVRTPTMEKLERIIRAQVDATKDDERLDRLIVALAESNMMVAFERTYRNIFGSQIEVVKRLNTGPATEKDLRPFYEVAVSRAPEFYRDYPFESWMRFLKSQDIVDEYDGVFAITDAGRDFLRYLLNLGYPESKPG